MFRYGTGVDDWLSIQYDWCAEAYPGTPNIGRYRWGWKESATGTEHYSYSTSTNPFIGALGPLKFKRIGSTIYFWNDIDSQWESLVFPAGATMFDVSFGIMVSWYTSKPMTVDFDNFVITFT